MTTTQPRPAPLFAMNEIVACKILGCCGCRGKVVAQTMVAHRSGVPYFTYRVRLTNPNIVVTFHEDNLVKIPPSEKAQQ